MTGSTLANTQRAELIRTLGLNRALAHQYLFAHRHPDDTPPFHDEIIEAWHANDMHVLFIAFRDGGKSTIAEEGVIIGALFRNFRNCVIIGENEARAIDRLTAIAHELLHNEAIVRLFGNVEGPTWGASKIVLNNGVVLQALGRRQEVRGMKHLDARPDFLLGDDLESEEHVKDAETRRDTLRWLFGEVIPAMDKNYRARILATPLDVDALPITLARLPDWHTIKVPIKYRDPKTNKWVAAWPSRYPLEWIDAKEATMQSVGLHHAFMREYMCEAEDPGRKTFVASSFKVVPREHIWQATWLFYDPARTTNVRSSTTGVAAWSWSGNRLIVWEGDGLVLKPDEMIAHMFKMDTQFNPVMIGVERDGLEEFLLQPLRHEMHKRGHYLPIEAMRAPRGKLDFISGLQPLFMAGEIEFAKPLPGLEAQLLSYPTGKIDAPNALAYALLMKPGLVFYEDFGDKHIVAEALLFDREPVYLAINATQAMTTGVLVQHVLGTLRVLDDYVMEGDPGTALPEIVKSARLRIGDTKHKLKAIAPPVHWDNYNAVGVRGAAGQVPIELRKGAQPVKGRDVLRQYLTKQVRQLPAFQVAHSARWTLNGLAAGYCREVLSGGNVKETAKVGVYRVLLEGLESFAGLLNAGMLDDAQPVNWAYTPSGVRYMTAQPQQRGSNVSKADYLTSRDPDVRRRS